MGYILLIDDEEIVRFTIRQMLEGAGYQVREAGNGNEGLKRLSEENADLVITDIIMPEKEGVETIKDIRRQYPEIKIIAMSGGGRTGNMDFLRIAVNLGATLGLKKPFSRSELLAAVRSCLKEQADGRPP